MTVKFNSYWSLFLALVRKWRKQSLSFLKKNREQGIARFFSLLTRQLWFEWIRQRPSQWERNQGLLRISLLIVAACLLGSCSTAPPLTESVPVVSLPPVVPPISPPPEEVEKIPIDRQDQPLRLFHQALLQSATKTVNILHLGDSHTAGDRFSGRLREQFQAKYGAAGRGMLPVGEPFAYFRPTQVKVSQNGNWQVKNSFKTSGHYGISGFTTSSERSTDSITLEMTEGNPFEEVEIEFLRSPNAGTILVEVNSRHTWEIVTKGTSGIADREVLTIPGGGQWITLSPKGDGPIELLSWNFRNNKGILYHSHGIVGVTIHIMNQWDPSIVAWELQQLNPALILLAFGTNEGFNDRLKKEDYERSFREKVKFLQQSVPQGTSIVIIGPPDAQRLPGYCPKTSACSSLDDYEIEKYSTLLAEKNRRLCRWHSPPMLNVVREIQRRVANEQGYFFWDWSKVMGEECGTHFWAIQTPSLAAGDHVHLTSAGYHFSAETLFNDLMIELSRY